MIEKFNGIFYFVIFLAHFIGIAVYCFQTIVGTKSFMDKFDIDHIISPFLGGGSFEFYLQNKYNRKIISNDKFTPLYMFWKTVKENTIFIDMLIRG